MTTQLKCAECNEMFEVSTEIAEAMHRWREQSGEPVICGECAGVDDIYEGEVTSFQFRVTRVSVTSYQ